MTKFAILAVLFAALIAVASATTYTTVVTTTVDEENPRQQSCQTEIEEKSMSHCRMWMMEGRGGRQDSFLRSAVANPRYQEEHLQECCDQMKKMSSMCVCDAIKKMMMEMQSKYGTQEMQQMMKKAEMLPQMCDMKSPTECRMRAVYF